MLQALAPPLQKIAQFVQQNATWLVPLVAAIAGVVAGIKAWAIVQAIINAELWANPVGVIIAAIVALIAIIVLVVKNWDTIAAAAEAAWGAVLDIVLAVWNGIKDAAAAAWEFVLDAIRTVWEWIQDNWPLLLAILTGPFGIAVALIISNWDSIKGFFSGLIDAIGNIVGRGPGRDRRPVPMGEGSNRRHRRRDLVRVSTERSARSNDCGTGSRADGTGSISRFRRSTLISRGSGRSAEARSRSRICRSSTRAGSCRARPSRSSPRTRGPEAVVPLGRGSGVGGSSTFNISVSVAPGTSPAEVGAGVVDAIRAYERVAGKGWRAA